VEVDGRGDSQRGGEDQGEGGAKDGGALGLPVAFLEWPAWSMGVVGFPVPAEPVRVPAAVMALAAPEQVVRGELPEQPLEGVVRAGAAELVRAAAGALGTGTRVRGRRERHALFIPGLPVRLNWVRRDACS
jgi:hypothetical protein